MEGNSPQPSDEQLLAQAAQGDGRAFHALLDRHARRLYGLAYSLIGNSADAEDVVQETFAGAYKGISRFEGRASVSTWLTRILVTQAAGMRRSRRRRPVQALEERTDDPSVPAAAAGVDARIDLRAALAKLSPQHREVLVLREFEQMSYEQIATVLGVPRGTIESRLFRARAELREKLSSYLP